MSEPKGLHDKYVVFKTDDFDPYSPSNHKVDGCFVLRPEKDEAALEALEHYALRTPSPELQADLLAWARKIRMARSAAPFVNCPPDSRVSPDARLRSLPDPTFCSTCGACTNALIVRHEAWCGVNAPKRSG